jgi:type IV pilus assembly protein PilP
MTKRVAIIFKMMLIIGMIGLISCSQEAPPAPASNVVKKKIVVPTTPAPKDNPESAQAPAANAASVQPADQVDLPSVPTATIRPPAEPSPAVEPMTVQPPAAVGATAELAAPLAVAPGEPSGPTAPNGDSAPAPEQALTTGSYDPQGRFDPFAPLFKEQATAEATAASKGKHQKRVPQTPLEKVALSQLKLSAIIRASAGHRALVADASGKGYVVQPGTYIGLNSGKVVQIERDRIVIEEEIEDLMGEVKVQNSELKLQKPAGEF